MQRFPFSLRLQALYLDRQKHRNSLGFASFTNRRRKEDDEDSSDVEDNPHHYSYIFNDIETQMTLQRAVMMQRLVQDPFYAIMNVNAATRMWMLRHLPNLAEHADHQYHINLMEFFEFLGREEMYKFLRYKSAPREIMDIWDKMYPLKPPQKYNANKTESNDDETPAKKKRRI